MTARILWITDRYPPQQGGMAVSCARQVRGLRRRGYDVDVLVLGAPSATGNVIEHRDGGVDLLIPQDDDAAFLSNHAWLAAENRHLQKPYTLACGFGAAVGGFHAVTFGAWLGLPATVLVRGNDFDRDWFWPQRGSMLREALERASAVGAVTQEKVRRIQALYPRQRVEWTPNGIETERWTLLAADHARRAEVRRLLGAGGGVKVIGLFGELKAKKRVPFWLEAVRDRGLLEHVRLLVVGTLDAPTAAILDDPALAPRSMRIPFCNAAELPGLYAACDFVAIPSLFEGMPNVLLEAMACGVVPLVSSAGSMADVIRDGDNGFTFNAVCRDNAGDATVRALSLEPERLAMMSARVKSFVATEFSPERELDVLARLLGL
jgi:glycosyltransferase involved in cell wall biosynthesis